MGNGFGFGTHKRVEASDNGGDCDPEYSAYLEGECAYIDGRAQESCVYPPGKYRDEWLRGFGVGRQKAKMGGLT